MSRSETRLEYPEDTFNAYVLACEAVLRQERVVNLITQEQSDMLRATQLQAIDELKLTLQTANTREFYQLWGEKRLSSCETHRQRYQEAIHALNQQLEAQKLSAIELVGTLPAIKASDLKPGHIYRGALARNLRFSHQPYTPEKGLLIEDMAFHLTGTGFNQLDFTGLHNPELALHFALNGWVEDQRTREDAIVIEVDYAAANQLVRLSPSNDKHFFPATLFNDTPLRLYRPEK